MAKVLYVNPEKCVGCMTCVLACSLEHGDTIGPAQSRIFPVRFKSQVINIPMVCRQCTRPLCALSCPVGAITRNEATGAMIVEPALCIGCWICVNACPLGGISLDTEAGHAVKCDLCGGDPLCAQVCAYGALEYIPEEEVPIGRKREAIGRLAELLETLTERHSYKG
jgi:Fe-S-cluster-containing hydrogenase component 2